MDILLSILDSFSSLSAFFAVITGIFFGVFVGATPGLSPAMGVALLVPFSYELDPTIAFILFVSTYQAANYGGSITAILLNTPGTASAVVTALDGYPLSQQGKALSALRVALIASTIGGILGTIVLIICSEQIASVALSFGPSEYCMLAVFGASTAFAFTRGSISSVSIPLLLGFIFSAIGLDNFTAEPRLTFGISELEDGLQLIPLMIGLFALGEVFYQIGQGDYSKSLKNKLDLENQIPLSNIIKRCWKVITKSSIIGTLIGVMPGAGATIAAFVSYSQAQKNSPADTDFGKGAIEGVAASEAANSSSVGGALVPLLALGIPGSATDAVLLGALTLHGLVVGPELVQTQANIVYGIFGSLIFTNLGLIIFGLVCSKYYALLTQVPRAALLQGIAIISLIGSYAVKNSLFDCWVCLAFGILGYILKRYRMQSATLVLGFILGSMIEENFRRSLLMGDLDQYITRPVSAVLLILTIFSLVRPLVVRKNN